MRTAAGQHEFGLDTGLRQQLPEGSQQDQVILARFHGTHTKDPYR